MLIAIDCENNVIAGNEYVASIGFHASTTVLSFMNDTHLQQVCFPYYDSTEELAYMVFSNVTNFLGISAVDSNVWFDDSSCEWYCEIN